MGCIAGIGKVVIVIINIVVLLLSLAMIVCGAIIVSGSDIFTEYVDQMDQALEDALTGTGLDVDTSELSLSEIITPIAYGLIAIGVVLGAISLLGCIGACYKIKCILIVYTIIITVVWLVQVAIVVVIYTDKSLLDSTVKQQIKDTLKDYAGVEGTDATTLAWNALMVFKECCGVDNSDDFDGLSKWPPATIDGSGISLQTPLLCCKSHTTDYTCATAATDSNNNMNTGCYDALFDMLTESAFVLIVICGMLGAQFALIFFSIWILCTMDNKVDII